MAAADEKAVFAIELEDGVSSTAESAAKALEGLRGQISADTKALSQMESAMRRMQKGTVVNVQAFKSLQAQIAAKKAKINEANAAYINLGGTFGDVGKKGKSAFAQLLEQAKGLPGPLGKASGALGGMNKELLSASLRVAGVLAVAAALTAVAVAAGSAALSLLKYGIASADARRNEALQLEGLTKLRNWYGLAAGNATEMQSAIDKVSGATPVAREQLSRMTDQLYRMGLRGENLSLALEGAAIKTAAQGQAAGSAFMGWAAGAALAGGSVKKLTDDVKARLGGIVARQMLSLDVQSRKLHESFAALFGGLNIEPFLRGLNTVTSLFSQSSASGRALKSMLTVLFQPVINGSETAGIYVKRFFQGMVIGALTIGIALLKVRNWFKRTFGDSEILSSMDKQKMVVYAGAAAVGVLGAALVGAAVVASALAVSIGLVGAALGTVAAVVGGTVVGALFLVGELFRGLVWLGEKLGSVIFGAVQTISEIDWVGLGTSIALGIRDGITGGAKWVISAISDMGESAWKAFKSKLGIASPSKKFAQLGVTLPQGVEKGVESGTPALNRRVGDMIRMPKLELDAPAPAQRSGKPPEAGAGAHVEIHSILVQVAGGEPKAVAEGLRTGLVAELQIALAQLGVPRVPA